MLERFKGYELVFLSLMKDGPVYGYELAGRLEKMMKGHIKVSYGTVYPFLRRIEKKRWTSSTRDEASGRVYYKLTPKGKLALEKLLNNLEETQEYYSQKLLGVLAIYAELFGRKALDKLLKQAQ